MIERFDCNTNGHNNLSVCEFLSLRDNSVLIFITKSTDVYLTLGILGTILKLVICHYVKSIGYLILHI